MTHGGEHSDRGGFRPGSHHRVLSLPALCRAVCEERIGDPAFERVGGLWCAEAVVPLRPCPGGLDGAEQGIEVVAGGVIGQGHRRFDTQAVRRRERAVFDLL